MPTVSVIMPVFNAASTVKEAVESILFQTYRDFELLLVDDGSTDDTFPLLQEFAAQDSRIKIISIPHGGPAAAMNAGLAKSSGEFIARMDADDFSYPERLERQVAFLQNNVNVGVVSCEIKYGGNRKTQLGYALHVDWVNTLKSQKEISLGRFADLPVAHPSIMFRRSLMDEYGNYDEGPLPEDYEILLRWMDAGVQIAKVPEILFTWNDPPGRISRIHENYSSESFAKIKSKYLFRWLQKHNPHHPNIVIWGAGRRSRGRSNYLLEQGCVVTNYLDLESRENLLNGVPIHSFRDSEIYSDAFVISYVNKRGAPKIIRNWLLGLGKIEGQDFLLA